jgi:hypothetical protein
MVLIVFLELKSKEVLDFDCLVERLLLAFVDGKHLCNLQSNLTFGVHSSLQFQLYPTTYR